MRVFGLHVAKELVWAALLAQFLSFLLCIMGTTSEVLANKGINAPTTQSLLNYCLLASTCFTVHMYQNGWRWKPLRNHWGYYAMLAFLDVEGNFLVTKAYQYTSITSVTLLDCFTIPAVMVLSVFVFRSRYSISHILGAGLCVLGLVLLVLTDHASGAGGDNPLLGDALVLMGATVYAFCNVAQERLLVDTTRWELLGVVGSFAALISGVQASVLEHSAWTSGHWDGAAAGALAGFAVALYSFAVLLPSVLMWGGSTVLNLSLLTSDLWAAGSRAIFFGGFGGTEYFFAVALVLEAIGIAVFTLAGETHHKEPHHGVSAEDEAGAADGETGRLLPAPGEPHPGGYPGRTHLGPPKLGHPDSQDGRSWSGRMLMASLKSLLLPVDGSGSGGGNSPTAADHPSGRDGAYPDERAALLWGNPSSPGIASSGPSAADPVTGGLPGLRMPSTHSTPGGPHGPSLLGVGSGSTTHSPAHRQGAASGSAGGGAHASHASPMQAAGHFVPHLVSSLRAGMVPMRANSPAMGRTSHMSDNTSECEMEQLPATASGSRRSTGGSVWWPGEGPGGVVGVGSGGSGSGGALSAVPTLSQAAAGVPADPRQQLEPQLHQPAGSTVVLLPHRPADLEPHLRQPHYAQDSPAGAALDSLQAGAAPAGALQPLQQPHLHHIPPLPEVHVVRGLAHVSVGAPGLAPVHEENGSSSPVSQPGSG